MNGLVWDGIVGPIQVGECGVRLVFVYTIISINPSVHLVPILLLYLPLVFRRPKGQSDSNDALGDSSVLQVPEILVRVVGMELHDPTKWAHQILRLQDLVDLQFEDTTATKT